MIFYVACHTAPDGLYRCLHEHPTVRDAMDCLVPDGGSFIRAFDAGVYRSLDNPELAEFVKALEEMPWSFRYKAKLPSTFPRPTFKETQRPVLDKGAPRARFGS